MPGFLIRILLAMFLPISLWLIGLSVPGVGALWLISLIAVYFFPSIEALIRESPDALQIAVLNLFLGWTVVGWVVALIWSVRAVRSEDKVNYLSTPKPEDTAIWGAFKDAQ